MVLLTSSPSRATLLVAAILNRAVGHLIGERVSEVDHWCRLNIERNVAIALSLATYWRNVDASTN
jgi:hypothetical protein